MTGGGSFGEGARDDEAESPSPGGRGFEEATRQAGWEPPGLDYPSPHPGMYHPGYAPGSAAPYPPPNVSAYQQPPGRPYPPASPPPGYGTPPGYDPAAPYSGGYPPPAYPAGYGPSGARPGTNGLAVASLVSSLTGGALLFHRLDRGHRVRDSRTQPDQADPAGRPWHGGGGHRDRRHRRRAVRLGRGRRQHQFALAARTIELRAAGVGQQGVRRATRAASGRSTHQAPSPHRSDHRRQPMPTAAGAAPGRGS